MKYVKQRVVTQIRVENISIDLCNINVGKKDKRKKQIHILKYNPGGVSILYTI